MTFCGCCRLLAADHSLVLLPSELKGLCSFVDAELFLDIVGTAHVTLIDENGNRLRIYYKPDQGEKVLFVAQDRRWMESEPGSPEEKCLLDIMKKSFAKEFDPPLTKLPDGNEARGKYYTQHAVHRLIIALERRCSPKK